MEIAVIGSNMVDLVTYIDRMPGEGETLQALDFAMGHGGKGANQAIAASRLGSEVLMLTRVGSDAFADATIANFAANGIDTRYVLRSEGASGVAPIFVDRDGNNSILIAPGANMKLTPQDIEDAAEDLQRAKLIVLQLEVPLETVYAAVEFGAKNNIPVLLNPAPADPSLDLDRIKTCAFFTPNESELALLTGMPTETREDVEAAARTLLDAGITNVIVTLGSRGSLWMTADGVVEIPAVSVKAVDTTGAGDAFMACFSHFYVKDGDVKQALDLATRYAADSVTKRGTQTSYATLEEFLG